MRGTAHLVNGRDPSVVNSFEDPGAVCVAESNVEGRGGELRHTFPAHSVTVLALAT